MTDMYDLGEQEPCQEMFTIDGEPAAARQARERILRAFCDLEFYEKNHVYLLHGQRLASVSSIGSRFESKPFKAEEEAVRYAARHGYTPEYWLAEWTRKSNEATTLGTKTHEFGESLSYLRVGHPEFICPSALPQYDESSGILTPSHPKEEAAANFLCTMSPHLHLVLNEARVYSGLNPDPVKNLCERICGTFDMLYYYDGEGHPENAGFVLFDYKTNRDLYSEYNERNHIMLLSPFEDLFQESYGEYTIQLSLYALMLEDIGLKILDRRLVWLKGDATFEVLSLPDVSGRLRVVL